MSTALTRALQPVLYILTDPATEDLAFQEPGVGWWLHHGAWHRIEVPAMTYARMHGIAVMAAAQTRQEITHNSPILDCDLLGDLRLCAVVPPAVSPGTISLTFRRGDLEIDELSEVPKMFGTSRWNKWEGRHERRQRRDGALLERYDAGDLEGFLRGLAAEKLTGLFVGPTGAGKTKLGKAIIGSISLLERIITIENAAEMWLRQPNFVRLFYATSGVGVTQMRLLSASLRMRPDRIMLAEMLDSASALVFVSVVMAANPGSYTTLHGRSASEAAHRLTKMLSDGGAGSEQTVEQLTGAIDFIMPVENDGGTRDIGETWFRPEAERRGGSFRDLLREQG